ncbi:MAG TPA: cytochrome c oxidase subunit 3 [Gammaproteobacteria bacterium]|nr:cytochrome c oxidase subunit 3 [Gammaproteobacteria bacterium]
MKSDDTESEDTGGIVLWNDAHPGPDMISTRTLGFWLYMLTDAMLFASIFTAYAILWHNNAGGPGVGQVVDLGYAFGETVLVFASVFAFGVAMAALKRGSHRSVVRWIGAAFLLGAGFLAMEIHEFAALALQGIVPERSGFLSSYYTLVLTHGLHILFGLLWMAVMVAQVLRQGFTEGVVYRLLNLRIFWHFQALIWVFIFTFVYLQGKL